MPSEPNSKSPYYQLLVLSVQNETDGAKSYEIAAAKDEAHLFGYQAGQFLSFLIPHETGHIVRSYSLSSAPSSDDTMTVCVKKIATGHGSNWLNDTLRAGMTIEATRPSGRFVLRPSDAPLFLIAGGSGITPCMSLIKQALSSTERRVKLVYANQNADSIIYHEQLTVLKNRFPDRFSCEHWLDENNGFLTPLDVSAAVVGWEWADCYICGPAPLMELSEETLIEHLGADAYILTERFLSPDDEKPAQQYSVSPLPKGEALIDKFRLTLDKEDFDVPISSGQTLLEATMAAGIDAPTSCGKGTCGTCMSLLREGDVSMTSAKALSKRDIERGHILACQARPISTEPLWIDFDI